MQAAACSRGRINKGISSMAVKTTDAESKSAWLVTWEGTSCVPEDPVAAILNYRMSVSRLKDFVGLLYASFKYSHREKLLVAKNAKENPYPATMTLFQHVHCGHNPLLHARLVSELKVVDGILKWTEPPSDTKRRAKISQ
jgi:hypothetical protein